MNGRPYRPQGPIAPMLEVERVDRAARWLPLWFALAAFVLFGAIVGTWRAMDALIPTAPPHERPLNP